jgi:16S rRNA processing protein RimM
MDINDFFNLGTIIKSFGIKGELVFYLDVDEPEQYNDLKFVFVKIDGRLIPFRVISIEIDNKQAIISLEDISTPDHAKDLVGKELYLPLDQLQEKDEEKIYYHDIIGFNVVDQDVGKIGTVKEVLEGEEQSLLSVVDKDNEILIPFVDEIVISVDLEKSELIVKVPEGLQDLNK